MSGYISNLLKTAAEKCGADIGGYDRETYSHGYNAWLLEQILEKGVPGGANRPVYNESTGRYENVGAWLDSMADGLVYGVMAPLYAYSPSSEAMKTGANAGLVLEPSTAEYAGRNDYLGKKLFACPRVNGGVDPDGTNYVTAIEGYDEMFDPFGANTYALTPVYWRRETVTGTHVHREYVDEARPGFEPCFGAYKPDGTMREFILRACYMDSDGTCDSRSGTAPGAYYSSASVPGRVYHSLTNDLKWSRERSDGLTYLTFGDLCWQMDMMELMLGVKAPSSVVTGCRSLSSQVAVTRGEAGVSRVVLTDANASRFPDGSSVSVGDGSSTDRYSAAVHSVAKSAKVVGREALGDGTTALLLDVGPIDVPDGALVSTMPWRNGSLDRVMGTFGTITAAGRTSGLEPFRFQNVEWNLGIYEVVCDMMSVSAVDGGYTVKTWYVAPDVGAAPSADAGAGWVALGTKTMSKSASWMYIEDYATDTGARVPAVTGGTSTTGYRTAYYVDATDGAMREHLVGGNLSNGADAGVGCAIGAYSVGIASWYIGGRSSGIGRSALAERG